MEFVLFVFVCLMALNAYHARARDGRSYADIIASAMLVAALTFLTVSILWGTAVFTEELYYYFRGNV